MTWEEWDRTTTVARPRDWAARPGGPDRLDMMVLESNLHGLPVTRADFLAAMTPEARARWTS